VSTYSRVKKKLDSLDRVIDYDHCEYSGIVQIDIRLNDDSIRRVSIGDPMFNDFPKEIEKFYYLILEGKA